MQGSSFLYESFNPFIDAYQNWSFDIHVDRTYCIWNFMWNIQVHLYWGIIIMHNCLIFGQDGPNRFVEWIIWSSDECIHTCTWTVMLFITIYSLTEFDFFFRKEGTLFLKMKKIMFYSLMLTLLTLGRYLDINVFCSKILTVILICIYFAQRWT